MWGGYRTLARRNHLYPKTTKTLVRGPYHPLQDHRARKIPSPLWLDTVRVHSTRNPGTRHGTRPAPTPAMGLRGAGIRGGSVLRHCPVDHHPQLTSHSCAAPFPYPPLRPPAHAVCCLLRARLRAPATQRQAAQPPTPSDYPITFTRHTITLSIGRPRLASYRQSPPSCPAALSIASSGLGGCGSRSEGEATWGPVESISCITYCSTCLTINHNHASFCCSTAVPAASPRLCGCGDGGGGKPPGRTARGAGGAAAPGHADGGGEGAGGGDGGLTHMHRGGGAVNTNVHTW